MTVIAANRWLYSGLIKISLDNRYDLKIKQFWATPSYINRPLQGNDTVARTVPVRCSFPVRTKTDVAETLHGSNRILDELHFLQAGPLEIPRCWLRVLSAREEPRESQVPTGYVLLM